MDWQRHLLAASGYLELGMIEDAARELMEIPPDDRGRNEIIGFCVHLYSQWQRWGMAAAAARRMVEIDPGQPQWWVSLAYATRRHESVEKAEEILLEARKLHPKEAIIYYNLACYACVTGRLEQARERLNTAIGMDESIRDLARNDVDLKPMRDFLDP